MSDRQDAVPIAQEDWQVAHRLSDAPATLESIARRRLELITLSLLLVVALAVGLVVLTFDTGGAPRWIGDYGGAFTVARVALVVLPLAFAAYVFDKERRLRRLTGQLVNSRVLESALVNRLNELVSISEASRSLGRTIDLDEAIESILKIGMQLLEADEGSLMLAEDDGLVVAAAVGRAQMFTGQRVKLDQGPAGQVARTREPVVLQGPTGSERGQGIQYALSFPLEAEGELIGVLNLSLISGGRRYTEYHLQALGLFAEHAALTIRRARLRRRDRVRAEMTASMVGDLAEPIDRVRRALTTLARDGDRLDPERRTDALWSLERELQWILDTVRRLSETKDEAG